MEGSSAGRNFGRKTDRGTLNYRGAVFTVVEDYSEWIKVGKKKKENWTLLEKSFYFYFRKIRGKRYERKG